MVGTGKGAEVVFGLVGAIGTDLKMVCRLFEERLERFNYGSKVVRISSDVIPVFSEEGGENDRGGDFARYDKLINMGNRLRKKSQDAGFLARASVSIILSGRGVDESSNRTPSDRMAYIISSLKTPDEVRLLRDVYSHGFFLVGVHADEDRRLKYLVDERGISDADARCLMDRDADESDRFGQHTRDTFHMADFFVSFSANYDKLRGDVWRILDIIFGKPFVTPTFDEFAMFMAFSSALRSADLSRQVGAVVAKDNNIVSMGANDIPKAGGGLYWPITSDNGIVDHPRGRDYKRGGDSNAQEKQRIVDSVMSCFDGMEISGFDKSEFLSRLKKSKIKDITEYGRVVHAEMEAIMASSRMGVSIVGASLYCTTFPCHNCAKHIIAAGVSRVVYVEPYPKSKALEFHDDSVGVAGEDFGSEEKVVFEPFVGVGPRSFFSLFSMELGGGMPTVRKSGNGTIVEWKEAAARIKMPMVPASYLERELFVSKDVFEVARKESSDEKH